MENDTERPYCGQSGWSTWLSWWVQAVFGD